MPQRAMHGVAFVFGAALLVVNEAVISSSNADKSLSNSEKYGSDNAFANSAVSKLEAAAEAASATMSVMSAVRVLQTMNQTSSDLLKVVQEHVVHHTTKTSATTLGPDVQASYSGVMKAEMRLNDMMYASHVKLDKTLIECKEFAREFHHRIEDLQYDSEYYSRLVTSGDEAVLNARAQKTSWGDKIPIAEEELKSHNADCSVELAELHHQLRIAKADADVMDEILNMTQCNDVAYAKSDIMKTHQAVQLMQCVNTKTGKKYSKMRATSEEMKKALSKLQHSKTLQAVSEAFVVKRKPKKASLVQTQKHGKNLRKAPNSDYKPEVWNPEGGDDREVYGEVTIDADLDPNTAGRFEKCTKDDDAYLGAFNNGSNPGSPGTNEMCAELRERFVNLAGQIEDAISELTTMIENKQTKCMQIRRDLEAEIAHYNYWYKVWETRLAKAVADLGEARSQFKTEWEDLQEKRQIYNTKMEACQKQAAESSTEMCALRTIRNELVKMSYWDTVANEVTDCVVAPEQSQSGRERREKFWGYNWDEGACTRTCGGGKKVLSRLVIQNTGPDFVSSGADEGQSTALWQRGMKCPFIRAETSCNEMRCPVDCELEEWEEWSRCTVTCGGGIRERMRAIITHPTPNGNPCELTLESEECNSFSCDVDCRLSSWTEWSQDENGNPSCTKLCGGGQRTRVKTLVEAAKGHGFCPEFYDSKRFQVKPCNIQPCLYHDEVEACVAPVDVLLVLDGSGSLGGLGFAQIKQASIRLAAAIQGKGEVGAILYSGTVYSCGRLICTGHGNSLPYRCRFWKGYTLTPLQCGIRWVNHLTSDVTSVTDNLEAMTWPAQNTLTSVAIKSAQVEMVNSRAHVPTVVIVITDGKPYSKLHTELAAKELIEQGGRLMMIPVGIDESDRVGFEKFVSFPTDDNLIPVENFNELSASNKTMNRILSQFCTQFKGTTGKRSTDASVYGL